MELQNPSVHGQRCHSHQPLTEREGCAACDENLSFHRHDRERRWSSSFFTDNSFLSPSSPPFFLFPRSFVLVSFLYYSSHPLYSFLPSPPNLIFSQEILSIFSKAKASETETPSASSYKEPSTKHKNPATPIPTEIKILTIFNKITNFIRKYSVIFTKS